MPTLEIIRERLARHQAIALSAEGKRQAAVAVVLRKRGDGPEVLFIERAKRSGDPWSGHMAFPGGRVDPTDPSARLAAERETREEVGVDLEVAEPLGRLDDLEGHRAAGNPRLVVSAFVYHLPEPGDLSPNHEVQEAFWFPLPALLDPDRHVDYPMKWAGRRFPGIVVGHPERHIVWGLTYRFLEHLLEVVGHPLPHRWDTSWEDRPERSQP